MGMGGEGGECWGIEGTYRSPQLQVVVTLHPLFGDGLGHTLGVPTLELSGQQVPQPPLQ